MLRRALDVKPKRRYADAAKMLAAYQRAKPKAMRLASANLRERRAKTDRHWKEVRQRQFTRQFGKQLRTRQTCQRCRGPVSECMQACPWCGVRRRVGREESSFPMRCPRCHRGMKLDWRYCPWCYGAGFEPHSNRTYSDARYVARCRNPRCKRRDLMPFMKYCPWCRTKIKRNWKIEGSREKCPNCRWGVAGEFWSFCPWCSRKLGH